MNYDTVLSIGDREVSFSQPSYFIADIAANHDGDLSRAKELIWQSKEAGADSAKFQHFLANEIVSDVGFSGPDGKVSHQAGWKKSVSEIYEQYHCRREWTDELEKTCREAGIHFMSTAYDFAAIDLLADLVPAFKIGSGDITWLEAVERISTKGKPVLLATGASSFKDVERAVEVILSKNRQLVLMQCNTNYSAHLDNFRSINLNVLKIYAKRWPQMVLGLSDHTLGPATVLGAVALGARVIEKHFTDDNQREGPDHHFAMNPVTWKEMVERTRELEMALGDGVKRVERNELQTVVIQRRSIRLRKDMAAGDILSRQDLEILRPCPVDAIAPHELNDVVGRPLKRALTAGEHLAWTDLD